MGMERQITSSRDANVTRVRSAWIVKVTAARTVIPDWMILWFGLKIQTWLTYRRSVQSRLCDVVSLHYFNVIPRLRTPIRDGIYLFICSILTFPTELFEFEYSVQGSLARYVILFYVFYVDYRLYIWCFINCLFLQTFLHW